MAKRVFAAPSLTYTAQADGVLTDSTYMALIGGSATQVINILELYLGGMASASTIAQMVLARSSTVGIIPTALALPNSDGPMHGATAALAAPAVSYVAAGTGPNRSPAVSIARMNLAFNAFGGIIRWVAAPGEEWTIVGNAVNVSETTLSNFSGGASSALVANIVYEPF